MRPFFPRLQGTKYRFTKYFDVVGAEMAAFVCFSSVFASFVKQHRLTIFFAASRDAINARRNVRERHIGGAPERTSTMNAPASEPNAVQTQFSLESHEPLRGLSSENSPRAA